MAQEDELGLPYLVFRTWRDYSDELWKVNRLLVGRPPRQGQKQLHQARKRLLEAKWLLLRRGMAVDDDWMCEVNAALLDNLALTESLVNGDLDFARKYLQSALNLIESYKARAVRCLEEGE